MIGPHQGQPVLRAGCSVQTAKAAMLMVHGRGASAESMLALKNEIKRADFAYLAPQAANFTWYPHSFLAPIPQNEPGISSGISKLAEIVEELTAVGLPANRMVMLGFSQGACLVLEFAARHARRYGGIIGLSGGLIGQEIMPRNYSGSFERTPVFLGCSDVDDHIPKDRVLQTSKIFSQLKAEVTMKLYPGLGHTINQDELSIVRQMTNQMF